MIVYRWSVAVMRSRYRSYRPTCPCRNGVRRSAMPRSLSTVPTIAANGIDLYYERSGTGPRLLFLNGSGSTLETSALLIKPFADRFDVAAHDQRGLGRTSIPPGPYTM